MSDQSGVSYFQVLFESALRDYERKTGITLANHPLAEQFQTCQSAESVTALLQEQARAFSEFRENNKIMRSLKNVVSVLSKISATVAVGQDFGTVCPRWPIGVPPNINAYFYSQSHLRMRYIPASVYYSLYGPHFVLRSYPSNF